jgi:DNA-binding beta-propeller fold protein YncE
MTMPLVMAALAGAMGAPSGCGDLKNNTVHIQLVSYRPDGSLVLCSSAGIYVYDASLRTQVRHIPLDALATPPFDDDGEFWFTVSADGSVAAASYSRLNEGANSRIATYRIPEGDLLNIFETGAPLPPSYRNTVYDMVLSPDGKLLYVTNGADILVFDTVSSAQLWTTDRLGHTLAAWSSDGATLFATQGDVTGGPDNPFSLDALDARTGAIKWSTDLHHEGITGVALVGDGGSLTGPAYDPSAEPCDPILSCPPFFAFFSSADGTLTGELPGLPQTTLTGSNPRGFAGFACNATDTCAVRMSEFTLPPGPNWQTSFVRLYKTDGTELQRLPMDPAGASSQGSMTISPDGKFVAIADDWGTQGGAKVFSTDDGTIVAAHTFPTETF